MASGFPFQRLPAELRLKIYQILLPNSERLLLDSENITNPCYLQKIKYGTTAALLRTSKTIRDEIIPILYLRNTVSLLSVRSLDRLIRLGPSACASIRTLECRIGGRFADLESLWSSIRNHCTSLENIKLVFYHERRWLTALADYLHETQSGHKMIIKIDMFDSIWAPHNSVQAFKGRFLNKLGQAALRNTPYLALLPKSVQSVTISASVNRHNITAFADTKNIMGWGFRKIGDSSAITESFIWEQTG